MAEAESNASLEIIFYSGAYSIVETCEECCVGALVDRVCLCHFPAVCYGSYGEVKYIQGDAETVYRLEFHRPEIGVERKCERNFRCG